MHTYSHILWHLNMDCSDMCWHAAIAWQKIWITLGLPSNCGLLPLMTLSSCPYSKSPFLCNDSCPGRISCGDLLVCLSERGKDENPDKGFIPASTVPSLSMEAFCCDGAVGLSWLPWVAMVLEDLMRPQGATDLDKERLWYGGTFFQQPKVYPLKPPGVLERAQGHPSPEGWVWSWRPWKGGLSHRTQWCFLVIPKWTPDLNFIRAKGVPHYLFWPIAIEMLPWFNWVPFLLAWSW